MRSALRLFGFDRRSPREPPAKLMLWLYALLCAVGLALTLSSGSGLVHALGVGLFGGCGGSWLWGRKSRDDARRAGRPTP